MRKPRGYWSDYSNCYEAAKEYNCRDSFRKGCYAGYLSALKNGWLEDYTWFVKPDPHNKVWDEESCEIEARKYTKWIDFKTQSKSAFYAAQRYKWIKNYTWLEHSQKPDGYWTEARCYEEALKFTNPTDFKNGNSTAYATACTNRWLKNYTWFEKKPNPNKKWDENTCRNEALKYETKMAFATGNNSAYAISLRNGWMESYTWFKECDNRKWTIEACIIASLCFKCRGDFAKGNPTAYEASRRNEWIDKFVWLKDERLDLVKGKIDSVYAYEFIEQNAVYVGRTLIKRQNIRDKEHLFNVDAVSSFAKENNIPVPPMKIVETDLTIAEGVEKEGEWVEKYRNEGWKILNRAKTGSIGGLARGNSKYTCQLCFELAQDCVNRSDYKKKYPTAYNKSKKEGWLENYTWFIPGSSIKSKYTEEFCRTEALKYDTLIAFHRANKYAYDTAYRNGWLKDYTWLKRKAQKTKKEITLNECIETSKKCKNVTEFRKKHKTVYRKSKEEGWFENFDWLNNKKKKSVQWTREAVEAEARKYKTVKEWRLNSNGSYSTAVQKGWRKEFDWLERAKLNNAIWTESACREVAEKCTTLKQYREEYASSYNAALKNGWVSDYTWLEKVNDIQVKEWTREMCEAESKKYTSRSAFYKGCSSAYHKSRIEGWLDDFVWLEPQRHEKDYWTEARCEEVARLYKRMYDFQTANLGAYNAAKRNGWLKNYTWLEMVYPNMKPRGYWDDYQHCYDEAKRHTEYKSFVRKSGGAYNSALSHGWLKDYTWLQGGNRGRKKGKNNKTDVTE